MGRTDASSLSGRLLSQARELLPIWLPGGKFNGNEYVCGNLKGGDGKSFNYNIATGRGYDFSTDERFGDMVHLYSKIHQIDNAEAFKRLLNENTPQKSNLPMAIPPRMDVVMPPNDAQLCECISPKFGKPVGVWAYRDLSGNIIHWVARYDAGQGKKEFLPWSWSSQLNKWVTKGWPPPRPLYGLELLNTKPNAPILLVEGEKACDAARKFTGHIYIVMTWSSGATAWSKSDWSTLYNRKVIIWPDADEPGRKAAVKLAEFLINHVSELKILDVSDLQNGEDAADFNFDYAGFKSWALPRVRVFEKQIIPSTTEIMSPEAAESDDLSPHDPQRVRSMKSQPICNMDLVGQMIETWPYPNFLWWDEFHRKYFTTWRSGTTREWEEGDTLKLLEYMQRELKLSKMSKSSVEDAIVAFGVDHVRNEPKEWMNSLRWDENPRIESFFYNSFGVPLSLYSMSASKNFWLSMVARVLNPGCKVDTMIILQGKQGSLKSTALSLIGGKWYGENHEAVGTKDFRIALNGKFLVEIAELDSFNKAESNTVKKIITVQSDDYRPPYGKKNVSFLRQCIFAGTTNDDVPLKDSTGGRRFWPINIGKIDLARIKEEREQLFAEAVTRVKKGETWWEMPEAETKAEQEARYQEDPWERDVEKYLNELEKVPSMARPQITGSLILEKALSIPIHMKDLRFSRRVCNLMRRLGWTEECERVDDKIRKTWKKTQVEQL